MQNWTTVYLFIKQMIFLYLIHPVVAINLLWFTRDLIVQLLFVNLDNHLRVILEIYPPK